MKELLRHTLDGTIVPEIKVLQFEQVGDVVAALKQQEVAGRVVIRLP